jgi:hypothetical protein
MCNSTRGVQPRRFASAGVIVTQYVTHYPLPYLVHIAARWGALFDLTHGSLRRCDEKRRTFGMTKSRNFGPDIKPQWTPKDGVVVASGSG